MANEIHTNSDDEEDAVALGCEARLEIRWANKMTEDQRMGVAEWLRSQAAQLLAEGHNYSAIYTAMLDPDIDVDAELET